MYKFILFLLLIVSLAFTQTYDYIDYYRVVVKPVRGFSPVDTTLYRTDFVIPITFGFGVTSNFPGWYSTYGDSNYVDFDNAPSLYSGEYLIVPYRIPIAPPVRLQLTIRARHIEGFWFPYKSDIYVMDFVKPDTLAVPNLIVR